MTVAFFQTLICAFSCSRLTYPIECACWRCSATNSLVVSLTIKWDLVDWTANGKTVWWWLHNYGTDLMRMYQGTPSISYLKFNWNLNGEVGKLCGYPNRPCYPWWALLVTVVSGVALILLVVSYCCCARALKRKAFRDYMRKDLLINDHE